MMTIEQDELQTARHEASHAVMYAVRGYDLPEMMMAEYVEEGVVEAGDVGGLVRGVVLPAHEWNDDLLITIAGIALDLRHDEDGFDFHSLHFVSRRHEHACGCDWCIVVRIMASMATLLPQDLVEQSVQAAYFIASGLIDQYEDVIDAIAADLVVRRRLSPEDVQQHCHEVTADGWRHWLDLCQQHRRIVP